MNPRSFSGVFEFSPRILDQIIDLTAEDAAWIVDNIAAGRCPRCESDLPLPPVMPAGSRVTSCRSIPICGPCGSDEVYEGTVSHPGRWPLDCDEIAERKKHFEGNAIPGTITVIDGQLKLVTADGVMDIRMGPSTGGRAEFGYQDGTFDGDPS